MRGVNSFLGAAASTLLFLLSSTACAFAQQGDTLSVSSMKVVDLGLSVDWAGYNIGASSPEEAGDYFSWGETAVKNAYYRSRYAYCACDTFVNIGSSISGTEYDAATAAWGDGWRMPSLGEVEELRDECDWEWITYKGVSGCKVTGPSGNSIFLPAAGIFWGGSKQSIGEEGWYWLGDAAEDEECAKIVYFDASRYTPEFLAIMDIVDPITEAKRIGGQTIRAVREHGVPEGVAPDASVAADTVKIAE